MLEAVFFDFGNTLAAARGALILVREKYTWPKFRELGADVTFKAFLAACDRVEKHFDQTCSFEELFTFQIRVAEELGVSLSEVEAKTIENEIWKRHVSKTVLYPGALETLQWLKGQNLKLAIVSNAWRQLLQSHLEHLSLNSFFDLVVAFEDTGTLKSDLKPFELALRQLEVRAEHVIHIGDRINEDGACRQLGIYYIWSTFHHPYPGHSAHRAAFKDSYDTTVNSYDWLLAYFKSLI